MKLNIEAPKIETSDNFEGKLFEIGDATIIFDILRSKLYTDPILAVCREIFTNARDANIEVGNSGTPIIVSLPNYLEPTLKIKDSGPGISPERMENFYTKFGVSTKRANNEQVGGYGIGRASILSYTSSFEVITIVDKIKYVYTVYIDETTLGKVSLMDQSPIDQPNSTEIVIPIKKEDYHKFYEKAEFVARYWKIKPIFQGHSISYKMDDIVLEDDNWQITKKYDTYSPSQIRIIVDGIPYSITNDLLVQHIPSCKLLNNLNGNIIVFLPTGSVSLSANREQLSWTKLSKETLKTELEKIGADIGLKFSKKIENASNLYEASVIFKQELKTLFSDYHDEPLLKDIKYKNINVKSSIRVGDNTLIKFVRSTSYRSKRKNGQPKILANRDYYLNFLPKTELYFNDLNLDYSELDGKGIQDYFDNNLSTLDSVYVISYANDEELKKLNTDYHFDMMDVKLLSTIFKTPKKYNRSDKILQKINLYKLNHNTFNCVSFDSYTNDMNLKCLLDVDKEVLSADSIYTLTLSDKTIPISFIQDFSRKHNISIYAINKNFILSEDKDIKDRIQKKFGNPLDLYSLITQHLNTIDLDKLIKCRIYSNLTSDYHNKLTSILYTDQDNLVKIINKISETNQNSNFVKASNLLEEYNINHTENAGFLQNYEKIIATISENMVSDWLEKNPEQDIAKLLKSIKLKYKMLYWIKQDAYNDRYYPKPDMPNFVDVITEYINSIDKIDIIAEEENKKKLLSCNVGIMKKDTEQELN